MYEIYKKRVGNGTKFTRVQSIMHKILNIKLLNKIWIP